MEIANLLFEQVRAYLFLCSLISSGNQWLNVKSRITRSYEFFTLSASEYIGVSFSTDSPTRKEARR